MKQKIKTEIYHKDFKGNYEDVRFSDLPKDIQENDIIIIQNIEANYTSNESYDGHTLLAIYREREETDEEYNKRVEKNKSHFDNLKQKRFENYLKLKEEFEPK
jgi:uncharacterized protein YxeA